MIKKWMVLAVGLLGGVLAQADDSFLTLQLPKLAVAEYHKPYVAVWIQNTADNSVTNLAVWYQMRGEGEKGQQWLKDMRQWWRRSGRGLAMPVDGISGATRSAGDYQLALRDVLSGLPAGDYQLNVEAAREVGGRELLQLPFTLPTSQAQVITVQGERELGQLELHLMP